MQNSGAGDRYLAVGNFQNGQGFRCHYAWYGATSRGYCFQRPTPVNYLCKPG